MSIDEKEKTPTHARAFVESSARAEDMRTSGVAFFVVGVLLIAVAVCVYLGVIPIGTTSFQKTFNAGIVIIFSIAFFAVSVYSTKRSKLLSAKSVTEERLTEEIIQYCVNNYVEPQLDDCDNTEHLEEERYFAREQVLREMITSEFKGLTESYIDYILDIVYCEIFEDEA